MTLGLAAASSLALFGLAPLAGGDPVGVWMTADGASEVRIVACAAAICGFPKDAADPPPSVNLALAPTPDAPRKQILWLERQQDNRWKGWVYSPRSGKTYRARLETEGPDRLKLTGCLVGPLCRSQVWTRSPPQKSIETHNP